MSKYLEWYSSSLGHTPTEKMAKDELESAHRKIKHATEALEKANERVRELEISSALAVHFMSDNDYVKYSDSVKGQNNAEASKKWLNKFAIEKKCEGIDDFIQHFRYEYEGARDTDSIESFADEFTEQLRKESESE